MIKSFYIACECSSMVKDRNKGITSILYNHLNLPELIIFENSNSIEYIYNAAGQKIKKTVQDETTIKNVDYLDGFQYAGEVLNFFPTAEGYVRATPVGSANPNLPPMGYAYSYVYNYTDHLGNVRLSYSMDHLTGRLKILEENHYYPFGLRHEVYVSATKLDFSRNPGDGIEPEPGLPPVLDYVTRMEYQYKFNGFEYQDELGLNWYDYLARNYDPVLGRWMNIDPLAEISRHHSPYAYSFNNPIRYIDPDGMAPSDIILRYGSNNSEIRLSSLNDIDKLKGIDNQFVQQAYQALNAMRGQADVVTALYNPSAVTMVESDLGSQFNDSDQTLDWNSTLGIEGLTTGEILSPASVLVHELNHFNLWSIDEGETLNNLRDTPGANGDPTSEVRAMEAEAASNNGVSVRNSYNDAKPVVTESSTSKEKVKDFVLPVSEQQKIDVQKQIEQEINNQLNNTQ